MVRASDLIDRLEKIGRLVLWLALAALCITVPIGMRLQAKEASRVAEQAAAELKAEQKRLKAEQEKESSGKPAVLSLAMMGQFMKALDGASGQIWFTNVSRRSGVLCVVGKAKSSKGETTSLPSCQQVEPFSSGTIKLMFAGSSTSKLCQPECDFYVDDATVTTEAAAK